MTAIETIAWIVVVGGLLKILVLAFNPKSWFKFVKGIWKTPALSVIYLVLAIIVFYYLVQELNIIQILAVMAFLGLLMGTQFARYSKETMSFVQKMLKSKKDLWTKNWSYILIWVILLVLGLIALI